LPHRFHVADAVDDCARQDEQHRELPVLDEPLDDLKTKKKRTSIHGAHALQYMVHSFVEFVCIGEGFALKF